MRSLSNRTGLAFVVGAFCLTSTVNSQTGGDFTITQSIVASGGSQNLAGGVLSADGTAGQSDAGPNSSGGTFAVRGGY